MYNVRYKYCNGELIEISVASKSIYTGGKNTGRKSRGKATPEDIEITEQKEKSESAVTGRGKSRARKAVFDAIACNPGLDTFFTLTINPDMVDSKDVVEVTKKINRFFDNMVRRHGLVYIAVAERHKKGGIHFHGLCNSDALTLVDSGHADKRGHKIYNIQNWRLGFSTAIYVYGDRLHVAKYITKYITKDSERVGGRWWYHGGALEKPVFIYDFIENIDIIRAELSEAGGYSESEFTVEDAGLKFTIFERSTLNEC